MGARVGGYQGPLWVGASSSCASSPLAGTAVALGHGIEKQESRSQIQDPRKYRVRLGVWVKVRKIPPNLVQQGPETQQ